MSRPALTALFFLLVVLASVGVEASILVEVAALAPPEQTPKFGRSVHIEDDTIVVGGLEAVDVYVRSATQWRWFQRLTDTGADNPGFGSCVKLDGDRLAVGSPTDTGGQVVIFERLGSGDDWAEVGRIDAGPSEDNFGRHLALDRETLMVTFGSRYIDLPSFIAAYELVGGGWQRGDTLQPADSLGAFTSLDLENGVLAVGNPFDNDIDGAVQVFHLNGGAWQFATEIAAPSPYGRLGLNVDIEGDLIATGAYQEDSGLGGVYGAAYLFRRVGDEWLLDQRLVDPHDDPLGWLGQFGHSIALDSGRLLVGSPAEGFCVGDCDTRAAKLVLFEQIGASWSLGDFLGGHQLPEPAEFDANLGQLSISGETVVSGSVPEGWFGGGTQMTPRVYEIVPSALEIPALNPTFMVMLAICLVFLTLVALRRHHHPE